MGCSIRFLHPVTIETHVNDDTSLGLQNKNLPFCQHFSLGKNGTKILSDLQASELAVDCLGRFCKLAMFHQKFHSSVRCVVFFTFKILCVWVNKQAIRTKSYPNFQKTLIIMGI